MRQAEIDYRHHQEIASSRWGWLVMHMESHVGHTLQSEREICDGRGGGIPPEPAHSPVHPCIRLDCLDCGTTVAHVARPRV